MTGGAGGGGMFDVFKHQVACCLKLLNLLGDSERARAIRYLEEAVERSRRGVKRSSNAISTMKSTSQSAADVKPDLRKLIKIKPDPDENLPPATNPLIEKSVKLAAVKSNTGSQTNDAFENLVENNNITIQVKKEPNSDTQELPGDASKKKKGPLFMCTHCHQKFGRNEQDHAFHIKLVHNIPCRFCSLTFTTQQSYGNHCRAGHVEEAARMDTFNCNLCTKIFLRLNAYLKHMSRDHNSTCDECGTVYASDSLLKDHMKNTHPLILNIKKDPHTQLFVKSESVKTTAEISWDKFIKKE
eukprot:TRINITY_DN11736_c0_g1_i1.p1 TRINITY_DN11736_c0_g1~~TRINITY_DN11736_c0_g1_i1.p1  ORF type:complete len:313 (-),score=64.49 TRINITY_DN11736_c0_g1_i1:420-1316(-)